MRKVFRRHPPPGSKPKILFLVTEDWYFLSHRLPLARAMRDLGWDVTVATRVDRHGDAIRDEGLRLIPLLLRRGSRAPWREVSAVLELISTFARERPDIIHQVGLKPVIYGSMAAMLVRPTGVVNALAGMGYVFTSGRPLIRIVRMMVKHALRLSFWRRNHWLIVQNQHDATALIRGGVVPPDRVSVIMGSGVDLERVVPSPEPEGPIVATVVGRMLKDKGVREVVLAARQLALDGVPIRCQLVGEPDPANPSSISADTLRQWNREGCIEWLGRCEDIAEVWSRSHFAVLPSYREGMPKALLEAAACGRPIITTDVPGCNDLVIHGVTGFTVPPTNWVDLAKAMATLAATPELRREMGNRMRSRVVAEFSEPEIVRQTLDFYRKALGTKAEQLLPRTRQTVRP